ncbi:hypothetical protein DB345_06280 [Spartobacteria bacterium LR76]|nr:hypothetical protein DB345_06280 [Spartobacteria bacterium LR76]
MPTIEISEETLEALRSRVKDFGESPETVIRRLLAADGADLGAEAAFEKSEVSPKLLELIDSSEFVQCNGRDRYLKVLKFLHDEKRMVFAVKACGLKFGKRIQIARTKEEIDQSGKSTFPALIPDTKFWVLTNLSNKAKRDVIVAVMERLEYPLADIRYAAQAIPQSASERLVDDLLRGRT